MSKAEAWKALAKNYRASLYGFRDSMALVGPVVNAILTHENYASQPVAAFDGRQIIFTVQVVDGMSPAQHAERLAKRLELAVQEIARLRAEVAELKMGGRPR